MAHIRLESLRLDLTQSMQNEPPAKCPSSGGTPGAVATEFWARGGLPVENFPKEIVMPVDAAVDAALAGLDQGELVTILSLPDIENWDAFVAPGRRWAKLSTVPSQPPVLRRVRLTSVQP